MKRTTLPPQCTLSHHHQRYGWRTMPLSLYLSHSLSLSPGASFYAIRQRRALIAPAFLKACLWREKPMPSGLNDAWQPRGIQPTRRQWQRRCQKSSFRATGKAEGFLRLHVLRESGAVQRKIAFGPSFDNLGWCQARRRRGHPDCQKCLTGRHHGTHQSTPAMTCWQQLMAFLCVQFTVFLI